jgi:hypothetical protein
MGILYRPRLEKYDLIVLLILIGKQNLVFFSGIDFHATFIDKMITCFVVMLIGAYLEIV